MSVVVSIGGSVLGPDDPDRIRAWADALGSLHEGRLVGVVVGGGDTARTYIGSARTIGTNEMRLDAIGIAATRLNARVLATAIPDATAEPPTTYEAAGRALRRGDLPVMGGVQPGQTTDAVGAALAESVGADRLVLATSVPGVFDADPNVDTEASRLPRLTSTELVNRMADLSVDAGSAAPVDLLAAKLIDRSGLSAAVVDGSDPATIVGAARGEEYDGTEIVPANGS